MSTSSAQAATQTIRKKAQTLSADEKKRLVSAFLTLKKTGRYDEYVHWHHHVMYPTIFDQLKPWKPTIADVLDSSKLGYAYGSDKSAPKLMKAAAGHDHQPLSRSPFWAD